MSDPLVHITTGAPCKGKLAAKALAVLVLDSRVATRLRLRHPRMLVLAEEALAPFGWPDREALARKLDISSSTREEEKDMSIYNVLVDVDTKEEHGAASYQAREGFAEAKEKGLGFIKVYVSGVERRVAVVVKEMIRKPIVAREIAPDVARDRAHARARALASQASMDRVARAGAQVLSPRAGSLAIVPRAPESDTSPASLMEAKLDACWPHCNCEKPTPWVSRRVDGPPWRMAPDEPLLEQRTCVVCIGTKSREIGR